MKTTAQVKVDQPETEWVDPRTNPEQAHAEIAALLESTQSEYPTIALPPDDLVNLPGGLVRNGQLYNTATVKELTGEDEEALSRASQSLNMFHFIDRLLKRGVVQIGDLPVSETENLLDQLLIGDREQLILGVRRSTYGEDLDLEDWKCPLCGNEATLSMQLSDIPTVELKNPEEDQTFEVKLRKGSKARVRLANGSDQVAIYDKKKELTQAERETILLSRCVLTITNAAGVEMSMEAFPSMSLGMSMPDRHSVLRELENRQPGPKYNQLEYKCEACGKDVKLSVGIGDLFLDIRWF